MSHLQSQRSKGRSIFALIETNLLLEWSNSIHLSAEAFYSTAPTWSQAELRGCWDCISFESCVSGCQNSVKIRFRVICADLLEVVQGGVTADKVRRRSALRVLCPVEPSPIILFKMWESGRQTERTLLWHPRFFFYFLAFHLTLRLNIWKSVAMATLSGWWGGSIRHVWQPACVEADGQPDSCPCWILLSPPGEAEQGWTN